MAIRNSNTGRNHSRKYSIEISKMPPDLMRGHDLVALCAAGSGHAGGTLSIMDITAALYLRVADHDPTNPSWSDRDRIIWSTGHKAPSLYLGLAFAGFCPVDDVALLRKLWSRFQGHPHWLKLPGVEVSTGSLGQGLSIAVGVALAESSTARITGRFCIMGDGEQQEGQIWEAAMEAGHYKLDNLVGIVDCNRLQIDGRVSEVMNSAAAGRQIPQFRLGRGVHRRSRHEAGRGSAGGSQGNRRGQTDGDPGGNGQGQRRELHGGLWRVGTGSLRTLRN